MEMKDEADRLKTYETWQRSYPHPDVLARAGFYFVGSDDRVKCAFCGICLGNWEPSDIPLEEHRLHSPSCSFLKTDSALQYSQQEGVSQPSSGQQETGQTQVSTAYQEEGINQSHRENNPAKDKIYSDSTHREQSFTSRSWSTNLPHPKEMAWAGFYLKGPGQLTRCFSCGFEYGDWKFRDRPRDIHERMGSSCQHLIQASQPETEEMEHSDDDSAFKEAPEDSEDPQSQHVQSSPYTKRLATFPEDWEGPAKEDLAAAGFIYKSPLDNLECFSCKKARCNWTTDDNPYKEHAADCAHIAQYAKVENSEFRNQINSKERKASRTECDVRVLKEPITGAAGGSNQPSFVTKDIPCIVCQQRPRTVLFQSCKHFVVCQECAKGLTFCPKCFKELK